MDLEMEMQVEPIVGKDEIRHLANEAADKQLSIHDSNPYPDGTRAHRCFQLCYWERQRWLSGEDSA